jgi:S-adenosylmethionine:tRNA ribosyltransferase-isomerase
MKTDLFNFHLPEQQIAQQPLPERDAAKLLVLNRRERTWKDSSVRELPSILNAGDLLVLNDTRVIPARLRASRDSSGGKVEFLLVPEAPSAQASHERVIVRRVLTKSGGKLLPGETCTLAGGIKATLRERLGEAGDSVAFHCTAAEFDAYVSKFGEVPLPPYIRREPGPSSDADRVRYQTVFAHTPGAVAAPTAGLHFSEPLLQALDARGVERAYVTLHVGPGTFKPVKADDVENHYVDPEPYFIPAESVNKIAQAKRENRRVIAVGTTSLRALESAPEILQTDQPLSGSTELFVYPPYQFKIADALLTNFHVPKSSLLMLVAAFAAPGTTDGIEFMQRAYLHAVQAGYRFYSYGDACLII